MAAVLWDLPVRPARDLHDRPDLHRAVLHVRDLRRVLSRLVQVRAIEDVEASQDLPRLRERPVGRQDLTLADADRDRGRQVTPERLARDVRTPFARLPPEGQVLVDDVRWPLVPGSLCSRNM